MKALVIGATGLLGQAIVRVGCVRGIEIVEMARSSTEWLVDVTESDQLLKSIEAIRPDVVVNCAAIVNLAECEREPGMAYQVNARPASIIAEASKRIGFIPVYISTDHYYQGDGNGAVAHDEHAPITLLNEYARTKYVGEAFTSLVSNGLVLRTNIVGHRGRKNAPTFAEWAISALIQREQLTLFDDVYTSSIHVDAFASAMFDLVQKEAAGVYNLASSEVSSKQAFMLMLAEQMGIDLDWATTGSGKSLKPLRADSMGLAIGKAEALLGYRLPGLAETVSKLVEEWRNSKPAQ
ncbi:SDR family oxidoreductase [Pseudomonadota bacterium]